MHLSKWRHHDNIWRTSDTARGGLTGFQRWKLYFINKLTIVNSLSDASRGGSTGIQRWKLHFINKLIEHLFYHGYCNYQRNAAVIILQYTMLRHNGLWEVIHISPFDTMWRNSCIWSSKSCHLHVDFKNEMWRWPCTIHISM